MPSKSKKQARTMRAAAHNPAFAAKMNIPVKVAKEFTAADKAAGKYKKGGKVKVKPKKKVKSSKPKRK